MIDLDSWMSTTQYKQSVNTYVGSTKICPESIISHQLSYYHPSVSHDPLNSESKGLFLKPKSDQSVLL